MPLNQLLHDEQVTLIKAADPTNGRDPKEFRHRLVGLDRQISAYPVRNHDAASSAQIARHDDVHRLATISLKPTVARLAEIDRLSGEWGVSRAEAVDRLIDRGLGSTSHLMRSS